jgi:hypothetical protein
LLQTSARTSTKGSDNCAPLTFSLSAPAFGLGRSIFRFGETPLGLGLFLVSSALDVLKVNACCGGFYSGCFEFAQVLSVTSFERR